MSPLCSHTVQVPSGQVSKRRYRIKQRKLERLSCDELDRVRVENLDWFHGMEFAAKNEDEEGRYRKIIQALETCGQNLVHLETDNGEIKLARIHCNNEFCPICGQNGSALHKKRTGRAKDRLSWAPVLGEMVYTLPDEISNSHPDRETLKRCSQAAWNISKKYFDTPGGVVRTHFMGETKGKFHIHFNTLFPRQTSLGEVVPEVLKAIKMEWTAAVNKEFKTGYEMTNSYYHFAPTIEQQVGKIKYVLRPVVTPDKFNSLSGEDREYIVSFKGWHNTRWFGKLANSQYKKYLDEIGVVLPEEYKTSGPISGDPYYYKGIVSQLNVRGGSFIDTDSHYHQVVPVNNDLYVDPRTMAYLKHLEKMNPDYKVTF